MGDRIPGKYCCIDHFELLAKKKVDRLSLSGVPVASALGRKRMREILAEAERRTGRRGSPACTRVVPSYSFKTARW